MEKKKVTKRTPRRRSARGTTPAKKKLLGFLAEFLWPGNQSPKFSHGEMPVYDGRSHRLFGVNRDEREFWYTRFAEGNLPQAGTVPELVRVLMPDLVNSVLLTDDPLTVVPVLSKQLVLLSLTKPGVVANRADRAISDMIEPGLDTRCNDWRVTPDGLPMGSTMHTSCSEAIGGIYVVGEDRKAKQLDGRITVGNGFGFLEGGQKGVYIDSPLGAFKFTFNPKGPSIKFASDTPNHTLDHDSLSKYLSPVLRGPKWAFMVGDGLCIGTYQGHEVLFVAIFNGGAVLILDAKTLEVLGVIRVGAPLTTACCFGGKDNDVLFITTSREGMNAEELAEHDQSGNVAFVRLGQYGIKGRQEPVVDLARMGL